MYHYKARLVRVIDGDTIEVDVDLGFHIWCRLTLRLAGINAPEKRGETKDAGMASSMHLASLLGSGELEIITHKTKEKYGRFLADVFVNGVDVNFQMVADGQAVTYELR